MSCRRMHLLLKTTNHLCYNYVFLNSNYGPLFACFWYCHQVTRFVHVRTRYSNINCVRLVIENSDYFVQHVRGIWSSEYGLLALILYVLQKWQLCNWNFCVPPQIWLFAVATYTYTAPTHRTPHTHTHTPTHTHTHKKACIAQAQGTTINGTPHLFLSHRMQNLFRSFSHLPNQHKKWGIIVHIITHNFTLWSSN